MLKGYKRAILSAADSLGWLNWVDQRALQIALETNPKTSFAHPDMAGGGPRFEVEKTDGADDEEDTTFQTSVVVREPCCQPGPDFACEPEEFVEWVKADLLWIDQDLACGTSRLTMAEHGRKTRIWIEDALRSRRSRRSEKFVSALMELHEIASAIDGGVWEPQSLQKALADVTRHKARKVSSPLINNFPVKHR